MFGMKKVALAAAMLASGILSFSPVPAGAQAMRLGLADQRIHGAAVEQVEWRGGPRPGPRPGYARGYRGPVRGPAMAPRRYPGRYVGPRYAAPRYAGPRYAGPRYAYGRPGWRPGPGWRPPGPPPRPGWGPPPGAWGPGRWYPGWGWWRPGWGWGYYDNSGAWIALGMMSGLALGAAAAATAEPVYPAGDAVAYCMQRYRSYNPRTGTFTGYDGLQHPCP
ncbi:BA14K family protein [Xanthobacter variabilis]|uniref:BA14K family protein n=1 Tax=Xanthobacter variabilis TaxID=3119932 RepID=UPI00374EAF36